MNMKKRIFTVIILFGVIFALSSCVLFDSSQRVRVGDIPSTDLTDADIVGLRLGLNIKDIDQTKLSLAPETNKRFDYTFDNDNQTNERIEHASNDVFMNTDTNDNITYIHGYLVNINGEAFDTVERVKAVLGEHYNEYWFDRELGYRAITYADKKNNIVLTVVYFRVDDDIIWAILSRG
jgi:hypothetical protein